MRSGVGAAWPFTFLLFLLLELLPLVDFFVAEPFVVALWDEWVAVVPVVLLCADFFVCAVALWAFCAATADTVNGPAVSAAGIEVLRFFCQSSRRIAERMSPATCCPPEPHRGEIRS